MSERILTKLKRLRPFKVALLAVLLVPTLTAMTLLVSPCRSQSLGRNYEYIFDIETEQVRDEFEYSGSQIGPVIKTRISYIKPNSENEEPVAYENLWMHGWRLLGARRIGQLELTSGQIAIQIKHKTGFGSLQEGEAAAKAALRLFVDLYARRHSVSIIIVPDESMDCILNQMPQAGFTPGPEAAPDVPVYSPIIIPIRTASGSRKQVLYYTTPPDAGDDD